MSIWPPFFSFSGSGVSYINFSRKQKSTNLNHMDNSSGESIFFGCFDFFLWPVLWWCCFVSCCLVPCGSGPREMPAKRANKPPTNCEVWRLPKPWCKHCQHIKVNKRSWDNISLCTGGRPKDEADPPQLYWPPSMHPCFHVFVRTKRRKPSHPRRQGGPYRHPNGVVNGK